MIVDLKVLSTQMLTQNALPIYAPPNISPPKSAYEAQGSYSGFNGMSVKIPFSWCIETPTVRLGHFSKFFINYYIIKS